jgi:hypothetical protein
LILIYTFRPSFTFAPGKDLAEPHCI